DDPWTTTVWVNPSGDYSSLPRTPGYPTGWSSGGGVFILSSTKNSDGSITYRTTTGVYIATRAGNPKFNSTGRKLVGGAHVSAFGPNSEVLGMGGTPGQRGVSPYLTGKGPGYQAFPFVSMLMKEVQILDQGTSILDPMVALYGYNTVKDVLSRYTEMHLIAAELHASAYDNLPAGATVGDMRAYVHGLDGRYYRDSGGAGTNLRTGAVNYLNYTPIASNPAADISNYLYSFAQYFHEPVHYFWQPVTGVNGRDASFSETMAYVGSYSYLQGLNSRF
ncbi:MAG: hypothetical protein PHE83_07790, partial [Opitutaceae bacterium]|nr:hypothetical protein [Opitutaceae bacterium]